MLIFLFLSTFVNVLSQETTEYSKHCLPKSTSTEPSCVQKCQFSFSIQKLLKDDRHLEGSILARLPHTNKDKDKINCEENFDHFSVDVYMYGCQWPNSYISNDTLWNILFQGKTIHIHDCNALSPTPEKFCTNPVSLEQYLKKCNYLYDEKNKSNFEWRKLSGKYNVFRLRKIDYASQPEADHTNEEQEETEHEKEKICDVTVNNVNLPLSIGLGITLFIFIVISIVIFVALFRAKNEIRCLQHEYVKSSAQMSVSERRSQNMESVYDVIQSPPDSNNEASARRKQSNRPSSAYENIETNTSPNPNLASADINETIDGVPVYAIIT